MTNAQFTAGARDALRRKLPFATRHALMLGSALGFSIAIAAAAPGQAWAADECGADVAGVATCDADGVPATDANPYPTGIDYVADPLEDITVILTGAVAIVTPTDDGVTAVGVAGYSSNVVANAGSSIDAYGDGIDVFATGGNATVLNYATIISGAQGIEATSSGVNGDTFITNYGSITVDGSANPYGFADGIFAASGETVVVDNFGAIDVYSSTDLQANGIEAFSSGSYVTVDSYNTITVENTFGTAYGIVATSSASGAYINQSAAVDVYGAGDTVGLDADAASNASVGLVGNLYAGSSGGDLYGIRVEALGTAAVTVTGDIDTNQNDYAYNNFGVQVGTFVDPIGGDATVNITGDVYVNDGLYGFGVYSMSNGNTVITIDGTVEVGGGNTTYGTGILAWGTAGGDVTIVADDVLVYQAGSFLFGGGDGINVYTTGVVDITAEDIVTTGYYADGVFVGGAGGISGNVDIDVVSVTTSGLGSDGIDVGGHGVIDVTATGLISTLGDNSDGMELTSDLGTVIVSADDITTAGDTAEGISAYGALGVTIGVSGQIYTQGLDSDGVDADASTGNVQVTVTAVRTLGDTSTGVDAYSVSGSASILSLGVVRTFGDFSDGLYAHSNSGTAQANSAGDTITTGLSSDGADAYSVTGDAFAGNYGGVRTYGDSSSGIEAGSSTGYSRATNYGGVYTFGANSYGLSAYSGVDAGVINPGDVYTYGADSNAINVDAGDDAYVFSSGTVYSQEAVGISVNATDYATVVVGGGTVYGYAWGIQSTSVSGSTIINNGAIYGGEGRAIDVDGGAAYLDNNDTIYGAVDLTDNADHFENDGLWEAYGTSTFGLGVDDVDNDGTTGFSRYQGAASITTFTGLEFFDNAGTVSGVDNQVGDQLVMTGTTFTGTGASEFEFDVALAGPGSLADRLVIGSAAGVTELTPNDILAGSPGVLNFAGILVVDSANAAEVGTEFVMDNVDKGFVEYSLFFDAATDNWLIVGLPDDEAFEMLALASSSQDFWRRSGDAWAARMQEIRDAYPSGSAAAGPGGTGRSDGWELWMQAHGGSDSFENVGSFTIAGFTFGPDLTADSEWAGLQFGFDNMSGNFLWGLTTGFVQQETRFDFDGNSFDFEGWNFGAYAGWNWGGLYLNGLVKADFYEVDANFHTIPVMPSFDGTTWGVQGEIGYHAEFGGWFIEPHAQLAWSTTDLDDFAGFGAGFEFDDADSLIGKAGGRIGGTFGSGSVVLTPYIGAYWIEEFEGENAMTFTSGGTSFTIVDQSRDNYGQIEFGATAQTFYGLEGFLKGEWNFGGDAEGGAARLGARWRW